jgi:hypothetical protein
LDRLTQCFLNVGDQIVDIFDPDAEAHEAVADAERLA